MSSNVEINFSYDSRKYDDSNALLLPDHIEKKIGKPKTALSHKKGGKKDSKHIRPQISNKKRKKLEKIIARKSKLKDMKSLIDELKKYQLPENDYQHLSGTSAVQTKGLKRFQLTTSLSSLKGKKSKVEEKSICLAKNPNVLGFSDDSSAESELELEAEANEENESKDCQKEIENQGDENISKKDSESLVLETSNLQSTLAECNSKNSQVDQKPTDIILPEIASQSCGNEKTRFVAVYRDAATEELRKLLPIHAEEQNVMEAIRYNPVVLVCGETGSGKTTQIPQFLYEAGYAEEGLCIAITEPRRVAAVSMSKRVASEMNASNGLVAYQIRYDGNIGPESRICFMTDGVLLREVQKDFLLKKYSVIVIDEAHERSLYSDILLGLLSRIVPLRFKKSRPLRLIVMSATLRIEDFSNNHKLFKVEPKLLKVESRQFAVSVHFSKNTPDDYLTAAYKAVIRIHRKYPDNGGILVFVTGQREVNYLCHLLNKFSNSRKTNGGKSIDSQNQRNPSISFEESFNPRKAKKKRNCKKKVLNDLLPRVNLDDYKELDDMESDFDDENDALLSKKFNKLDDEDFQSLDDDLPPLNTLPLYSLLAEDKQQLVFESPPEGSRLCVVSTNIAETSITIPSIKYVVDTGKVKSKLYDKVTGISAMVITWISKASADQRAGRAGRVCDGHCFRLYSSAIFNDHFSKFSEPEISCRPADDLVLLMKSMGIDNVVNFPFPTSPSTDALSAAEKRLVLLGAIERQGSSSTCLRITPLGRIMSYFPVGVRYAKILALAAPQELLDYAIAIISALTVQEIFSNSLNNFISMKESGSDTLSENVKLCKLIDVRKRWAGTGNHLLLGDIMVLLKAVGAFDYAQTGSKICEKFGLRLKAMQEIRKLRLQLTNMVSGIFSFGPEIVVDFNNRLKMDYVTDVQAKLLRQLMLCGFVDHVGRKIPLDELPAGVNKQSKAYKSVETETIVYLRHDSPLYDHYPEYVAYQEIYENNKLFLRNAFAIEPEWLAVYAPTMCNFSKPLENPAPRYDAHKDMVMCHANATFGPYCWPLPVTEVEYPPSQEKYRWFAAFLLDGLVLDFFLKYREHLLSSPYVMTKTWAKLQPRTEYLLSCLIQANCTTKATFLKTYRSNSTFMLADFCQWLPSNLHSEVQSKWSEIGQKET